MLVDARFWLADLTPNLTTATKEHLTAGEVVYPRARISPEIASLESSVGQVWRGAGTARHPVGAAVVPPRDANSRRSPMLETAGTRET